MEFPRIKFGKESSKTKKLNTEQPLAPILDKKTREELKTKFDIRRTQGHTTFNKDYSQIATLAELQQIGFGEEEFESGMTLGEARKKAVERDLQRERLSNKELDNLPATLADLKSLGLPEIDLNGTDAQMTLGQAKNMAELKAEALYKQEHALDYLLDDKMGHFSKRNIYERSTTNYRPEDIGNQ